MEEFKTPPKLILKEILSQVIGGTGGSTDEKTELDDETIKLMLKDADIYSAWENNRLNATLGREWKITGTQENNKAEEIEARFDNINMTALAKDVLYAKIYGTAFFEILWNEEKIITEIKSKPRNKFVKADGIWKLKDGDQPIDKYPCKFIVCEFKGSLLDPILESWNMKKLASSSTKHIIEKFGETIMWYVYDPSLTEAQNRTQAESYKKAKSNSVIALPPDVGGLNEGFGFITASDLSIEVQKEVLSKAEEKISQVLLGGTLTRDSGGGSGSYALGQVHESVRGDIVESDLKYLRDVLQTLIIYDAAYFGYNPKEYYFTFEEAEDLIQTATVELKQAEAKREKSLIIERLSNAGIKVKLEHLSEMFGIPIEMLEQGVPKEASQVEREFSKKKSKIAFDRQKQTTLKNNIDERYKDLKAYFSDAVSDSVKKIKTIEDIGIINLDIPELLDDMITSRLLGIIDVQEVEYGSEFGEFDEIVSTEINPFKMKYQEAISSFLRKKPELFEKLGDITEKVSQDYFWVKKLASLESTNTLYNGLLKVLEDGGTFKSWKDDIEGIVNNSGLAGEHPYYWETVFRTNIQQQYAAGRYEQQMQSSTQVYWLYDTIMDGRESDICRALNGKVYMKDDLIWNEIYPPNHFSCRSSVIALDSDDVTEYNYSVDNSEILRQTEEYGKFAETSFKGNPGSVNYEKMAKEKEKAVEKARIRTMPYLGIEDIIEISPAQIKKEFGEEIYFKIKNLTETKFFKSAKYDKAIVEAFNVRVGEAYTELYRIDGIKEIVDKNRSYLLNGFKAEKASAFVDVMNKEEFFYTVYPHFTKDEMMETVLHEHLHLWFFQGKKNQERLLKGYVNHYGKNDIMKMQGIELEEKVVRGMAQKIIDLNRIEFEDKIGTPNNEPLTDEELDLMLKKFDEDINPAVALISPVPERLRSNHGHKI